MTVEQLNILEAIMEILGTTAVERALAQVLADWSEWEESQG